MEVWKDVKGYEGIYQVSNLGRVKSINHKVIHSDGKHRIQKGRILKQHLSKKGYFMVSLSKSKNRFHTGVHRLVAKAFIVNTKNKPQVNHKNGIKTDNNVNNLEWMTNSENQIHAINNNLIVHNVSEKHHMSKLTNKDVSKVRKLHKIGFTNKQLAEDYNVSQTAMSNILRNITYKNIK